jgi:hydrogenase-4 transcriptional activator
MALSPALEKRLAAAKEFFRRYQTEAALKELRSLAALGQLDAEHRAAVVCLLAECHERLDQAAEAAALLAPYEEVEARAHLSAPTQQALCLRLAAARTERGDHPAAISYAKQALALAEATRDSRGQGAAHLALGKVYRIIGQTQFARDHYFEAVRHNRLVGERVAIAQGYHGLSNLTISDSDYLSSRNYLTQALELISEDDEPFLYGHVCINLAVVSILQEEGAVAERVRLLEQAAAIFRRLGKDNFLVRAYTNLGYQLLLVGEVARAEEILRLTIEVGTRVRSRKAVANAYETLAELYAVAGEFDRARECIAAAEAEISGFEQFNEAQVLLTHGKLLWLEGRLAEAEKMLERSRDLGVKINYRQGAITAELHLAEIACDLSEVGGGGPQDKLADEKLDAAGRHFVAVAAEVDTLGSVAVLGHARLVGGRLKLLRGELDEACQALRQAASIFDLTSNVYLRAVTGLHLADAFRRSGNARSAAAELEVSRRHFTTLGARPQLERLARFERAAAHAEKVKTKSAPSDAALRPHAEALTRLLGATASRDLLLHELAKVLRENFEVPGVAVFERDKAGAPKLLAFEGCQLARAVKLLESRAGEVITLKPGKESPVFVALARPAAREAGLQAALKAAELGLELCALRRKLPAMAEYERGEESDIRLPGMVYSSAAMRDVAEQIHKIHGSKMSVLVTGESGTGKEGIARAIHELSDRATGPFIAFNCSVVSPELIDSQLFGHRKGSFTGAGDNYSGWIRAAEGGTLFLDEIGEMPLELQPKLLRFLQESEVHPVGETKPVKVNVRVIAATNRDLEACVADGKFREDLYYRLNVIRLHIPPLRERRDEIPLLAHHLLERFSREAGKRDLSFAPETLDALTTCDWPGNIRQLANEIQRIAAILPDGSLIRPEQLSAAVRSGHKAATNGAPGHDWMNRALAHGLTNGHAANHHAHHDHRGQRRTLAESVEELERQMIVESLTRHGGNISRSADELGLTRKGLYLKLERYGINLTTIKSRSKLSLVAS